MMKKIEDVLLGIGALVFLWATFIKVTGRACFFAPGTYWRGAIGCMVIATALMIRDMRSSSARM